MLRHKLSVLSVLFISLASLGFSSEENFLLLDATTDDIVFELGPHINERVTPCSTFKIALSLMGYDTGLLIDEKRPTLDFKKEYVDYIESWKTSQTPKSWIRNSCVWYSQILTKAMGIKAIQNYLTLFEYGNEDMTGGITQAWLSSSLKISPKEQVHFLNKIVHTNIFISLNAIQTTKSLLYIEEFPAGWKLFGKTGMGSINEQDSTKLDIGWFIGWVERDGYYFTFAYNIRDREIDPAQRIPRVKKLIEESGIMKGKKKEHV